MTAEPWAGLSPKAKRAVELVADGKSRRAAATEVELSHQAVNNACKSPAGITYRRYLDAQNKGDLYSATLAELRRRVTEWGGVSMRDLIGLLRVLVPQEVNVNLTDHRAEAEAIAAEIGKPELVDQIERDLLISREPMR